MDDESEARTGPGPEGADTLGARLSDEAQRIAARHEPEPGWARPAGVLLRHITAQPSRASGRFERNEAPAAAQAGAALPPDVRERLRPLAGAAVDAMRIHEGKAADAAARSRRADAVAVGRDVFFREGQFRPREPRGFGLLVHEATHVAQLLRPGVAWRRATGGQLQEDEAEALAQERGAARLPAPSLGRGPVKSGSLNSAPPVIAAGPPAAAAGPGHAMAAETGRNVEPPPARPAPLDIEELRRTLARDLMRQLRSEFERGG